MYPAGHGWQFIQQAEQTTLYTAKASFPSLKKKKKKEKEKRSESRFSTVGYGETQSITQILWLFQISRAIE